MKKIFFHIMLALVNTFFFSIILIAQSSWTFQNPYPTKNNLNGVSFIDDNTGFVIGDQRTILKTTNAGINWESQFNGDNLFFTSLYFLNVNTGYVTTGNFSFNSNSDIFKTTNSGLNWFKVTTFLNEHISSIFFIDENTGYTCGGTYWSGGSIRKTTNHGISWQRYIPNPTTNFINSIYFSDHNTGYAAGDDGEILKTSNGGLTWINQNPGVYTEFHSITFTDNSSGFVVGNQGKIYRTTNGGNNWIIQNSGTTNGLSRVQFIDSQHGYIVGGNLLLKTTDGGSNWQSINIENQNLRSMYFTKNLIGYLVASEGGIIKIDDKNNLINLSRSIIDDNLNSVFFVSGLTGFIAGNSGKIMKTSDAGNSWQFQSSNTTSKLNSIFFSDENTGFVSGTSGLILKTSNQGQNWIQLSTGINNYSLNKIFFLNNNIGYCTGFYTVGIFGNSRNGAVFKTTNGGLNWVSSLEINEYLYSLFFIDNNTGYSAGKNIFKTTDAGSNWVMQQDGTNSYFADIEFVSDSIGFTAGRVNDQWSSYTLLKTTNGGRNWNPLTINIPYDIYLNDLEFINENTGFASSLSFPDYGRGGDVFKTTDGGNNWFRQPVLSSIAFIHGYGLNNICFSNGQTGYLVGEGGVIFRTSNGGGSVNIYNYNNAVVNSFELYQNYPNPFNPSTTIQFNIKNSINVELAVYDITGRKIESLVNENLNQGSHIIKWDGSKFPSGIYIYQLIAGNFEQSKRMILLK